MKLHRHVAGSAGYERVSRELPSLVDFHVLKNYQGWHQCMSNIVFISFLGGLEQAVLRAMATCLREAPRVKVLPIDFATAEFRMGWIGVWPPPRL